MKVSRLSHGQRWEVHQGGIGLHGAYAALGIGLRRSFGPSTSSHFTTSHLCLRNLSSSLPTALGLLELVHSRRKWTRWWRKAL